MLRHQHSLSKWDSVSREDEMETARDVKPMVRFGFPAFLLGA